MGCEVMYELLMQDIAHEVDEYHYRVNSGFHPNQRYFGFRFIKSKSDVAAIENLLTQLRDKPTYHALIEKCRDMQKGD
jgi:cephalosporin hydroxylase